MTWRQRAWDPSREKERRKLRSHGTVLRARARRLINAGPDTDPAAGCRVVKLLEEEKWCEGDLSAAHDHVDQLEELLPYIADESYLRAALAYELNRKDEPIRLDTLLPETELRILRDLSGPQPPGNSSGGPDGGSGGDGQRRMAESLSLLARERSGQQRHDRLMTQLRKPYLVFFAALILGLLLLIFIAVHCGVHPSPTKVPPDLTKADMWARLLLVLSSGALGSVLAAASRLKDRLDLDSFHAAFRLIYIQPLVGAAFGLISWLILTAGVVTVEGGSTAWATQAAVAFASGFSEPFALGIVRRLTPGNPPAPGNRPPP
jgi:hypothetical protein